MEDSALTALREFQECSSQITELRVEQTSHYRQILDNILSSLLNSTDKALQYAESTRSVLERLLECVQHCVQALPLLFLPQDRDSDVATELSALQFSESLVGRLFMLLSVPNPGVMGERCYRVLGSLLDLYRHQNMGLLRQFLDNLLEFFIDVYEFCAVGTGSKAVLCHFGVALSFADQQSMTVVEKSRIQQAKIHIPLQDGGSSLLLSLTKLLVRISDDMAAFGSGRRFGRDRLMRSLSGLLGADSDTLLEASLEALEAFLKRYYPVTDNTGAVLLLSLAELIESVASDETTLMSSTMERLTHLIKTVTSIKVSPSATEEVLLGLSKAMQGLRKRPQLLGAVADWFAHLSASWECCPLDSVLQELRENLTPLSESADTNIVPSQTYVGILTLEASKTLSKSQDTGENVWHSVAKKALHDSFVGIKLDRLLHIRDTDVGSLKRVALCIEVLQQVAHQLAQHPLLAEQKTTDPMATVKATMRLQMDVVNERMVWALLRDCLDCRLSDEMLEGMFHILGLLLRCQDTKSAKELLCFVPAISTLWNTRFDGRSGLEPGRTIPHFDGAGSDAALCASLIAASFFPRGALCVETVLSLALAEGSSEVQKAALQVLCHCIQQRSASTAVADSLR